VDWESYQLSLVFTTEAKHALNLEPYWVINRLWYLYLYGLMMDWESCQLSLVFTMEATHALNHTGLSIGFGIFIYMA
jgi:hypothetical protein